MKLSNYNFLFEIDKKCYALNLISRSLIKITNKDIQDMLLNRETSDKNNLKKKDIDMLLKGGFLVQNYLNEIDILKLRFRKQKYDNENLSLTIIPTYNCNFNCTYCYQKQMESIGVKYSDKIISDEMLDCLEAYIKGTTMNKKQLHLEWFGGEPTFY